MYRGHVGKEKGKRRWWSQTSASYSAPLSPTSGDGYGRVRTEGPGQWEGLRMQVDARYERVQPGGPTGLRQTHLERSGAGECPSGCVELWLSLRGVG